MEEILWEIVNHIERMKQANRRGFGMDWIWMDEYMHENDEGEERKSIKTKWTAPFVMIMILYHFVCDSYACARIMP
jgi:hypothetical protein